MAEHEIPLSGGTLSAVVRVGETVRRAAGPWTPAVHDLLRHVRAHGFDLAPEPLGVDGRGREILTYIPGETVGWDVPWPEWVRSDATLEEVGAAVAAYHRAVAGFRPAGRLPWQPGAAVLEAGQIVCHNDIAPYNMVAAAGPAAPGRGRRLRGLIDWDLAAPADPRFDLAFAAWQWVPLHGPFVTGYLGWAAGVDRAGRLRRLLDAYGLTARDGFVAAVVDRIRYNRSTMLSRAAAGDPAYRALVEQGHIGGMDEALAFLAAEGEALQAAL